MATAKKPAAKSAKSRAALSGVEKPKAMRKPNRPEFGSDAVVDLLRAYGFDYAFLNPGSSFSSLQDSIVNYNGNVTPKVVLGLHEDNVTAMAQGYATEIGRAHV